MGLSVPSFATRANSTAGAARSPDRPPVWRFWSAAHRLGILRFLLA